MAQKLITLEEAAQQLGISKDRLLQLRTAGKVAGYRDGASWKFRSETIDKLAEEGIPTLDAPPSDIGLDAEDELGLADDVGLGVDESAAPAADSLAAAASGLDLELAEDEPAEAPMASDVSLEDVDEPTVAGIDEGGSSDALALDPEDSIDINTDSILLSETELGDLSGRPPSTIIGKGELDLDADLDLSPMEPIGPVSDVKLAPASDIIPGGDDDLDLELPSPTGDFAGIEEVEVDLEAESSRILSPEDVAKVKGAVAAKKAESDLALAPTDSAPGIATSDVGLGGSMASGTGLTGLSALELEDDDDQVLGEGSDVTLSGESSGINIISPSDSGLALDEVKLDLSGSSPIGSALDLGGSAVEEVALEPAGVSGVGMGSQVGGDFQLTPLGEAGEDEEERDSSQVIALDELTEETGVAPLGVGTGESGMLAEDFGVGLTPGAAPVGVVSAVETPFSVANVLGLASCLLLLGLSGMMVFDLLRNIWSWDEVAPLNSSLLESVLNPFL
ncbi:MAG: helix-turn-helix domain-containing protein [Planctomycetes bacterium]|nr:helix-turn-helix domain-containing protein [Planctomycetota bacterium]